MMMMMTMMMALLALVTLVFRLSSFQKPEPKAK